MTPSAEQPITASDAEGRFSNAVSSSRARRVAAALGRAVGLVLVATAWWLPAHRIPLRHILSCGGADGTQLFGLVLAAPMTWIACAYLTWLGARVIGARLRRGWAPGLGALIGAALIVAVLSWAYAWFLVATFAYPDELAHCANPWWLPKVSGP